VNVIGGGKTAEIKSDSGDYISEYEVNNSVTNELIFAQPDEPARALLDEGYRVFSLKNKDYDWLQIAVRETGTNRVTVQHISKY